MNGDAIIDVNGLTKNYGANKALRGVSFKSPPSIIFSILGPNGAGKTTLLRIMSGSLGYENGSVRINGLEVKENSLEVKRMLGTVYENPMLFPELSVRENLEFSGRLHGISGEELKRKVREVAETLDLKDYMDKKYAVLSKGLKRRADLASALIHEPPILILDEPTSGLDIIAAISLRELIRELKRIGITIVMSTHNITEAMNFSDMIVVLDKGIVRARGSPRSLRKLIGGSKEIIVDAGTRAVELLNVIKDEVEAEIIAPGKIRIKASRIPGDLDVLLEKSRKHGIAIQDITVKDLEWEEVVYKILRYSGCPLECPLAKSCVG